VAESAVGSPIHNRSIILYLALMLSLFGILFNLALKSFYSYLFFVMLSAAIVGISFALTPRKPIVFGALTALPVLLVGTSLYFIAVRYAQIRFYDSYQEIPLIRTILEEGRFSFKMSTPTIHYYGPYDTSSYPLLSILTSTFIMVSEIELPYAASLMTVIIGVATFLVVLMFIRSLAGKGELAGNIIALSTLFYATSPDAIAQGMSFYHRHLSLVLCFILLYLVFISNFKHRKPYRSFLVLPFVLFASLPITHSAYPSIYIVSMFTLTIIVFLAKGISRMLTKNNDLLKAIEVVPLFRLSLIGLASSFLWQFNVIYPSTLINSFRAFVHRLIFPQYEILELHKFQEAAFPSELRPEPYVHLLLVRDLLLWVMALAGLCVLAYELLFRHKKEAIFPLFATISFAPMFLGSYISGYIGTLEIRYYALPLIIFLSAFAYTLLLKVAGRVAKVLTASALTFLVVMTFLAPYSHVYFPRHIYDSSISFNEVGDPKPEYIYIEDFLKSHKLGDGLILSDAPHLLTIILDLTQWKYYGSLSTDFGRSKTYILEFVDLKPTLGYSSAETFERMARLKAEVDFVYCRVVSSGAYTIYYKG
jgi:hypothetical protein